LFSASAGSRDYLLSDEALAQGTATVQEVSEAATVSDLLIENTSDKPVLFPEGTELRGGKQSRVLNVSVLIAGGSSTVIPVTCVEIKRWTLTSPKMGLGSHCPPSLRTFLKGRRSFSHRSDQMGMWAAIHRKHRAMGVLSRTRNLTDALESRRDEVEGLRATLPYPEGASGIAVVMSGRVVCLDLFDQPETCRKLWKRLVEGVALDALETPATKRQPSGMDVLNHLHNLRDRNWQRADAVGLGDHYFAQDGDGTVASALIVEGEVVHASVAGRAYSP
jgi:hypothetical protein